MLNRGYEMAQFPRKKVKWHTDVHKRLKCWERRMLGALLSIKMQEGGRLVLRLMKKLLTDRSTMRV